MLQGLYGFWRPRYNESYGLLEITDMMEKPMRTLSAFLALCADRLIRHTGEGGTVLIDIFEVKLTFEC